MGKVNKKHVGLVACIVAILCSIALCAGLFVKANITDNRLQVNYEDDYYCDTETMDMYNPVIEDIYENYENGNFSLVSEGNKISYTVNNDDISKIENVSSALCMGTDKKMEEKDDSLLYLGYKNDCLYDTNSGVAVSEFDVKWLMLNGKQPLAMYNLYDDNGVEKFYTSAYINNEEEASNILLSKDESGNVTILGRVIDKDVDGNPLEEVQIQELNLGDVLCPAYVNYDYSVVNIANYVVNATEVYNEDTYEYGTDFQLSYETLPDESYLYSMRVNYKDDTTTEEQEGDYGYYTQPKLVSVKNSKIETVEDAYDDYGMEADNAEQNVVEKDPLLEGYDYVGCIDFLKQVWKHKKANTKEELRQAFQHDIAGVQKGYISTWNSLGINKALRTDTVSSLEDDDKLTIDTLEVMCKKIKSTKNYLMLRRVAADYLTTVFGIKGLNGEALTNDMVKAYSETEKLELEKNLQSIVGTTMVEKGFMSASMLPFANIMGGRVVEIVIKVPTDSNYYVSHNVVESEAIFPTNTELVIESVKYNAKKGKYIMIAKVQQNM